MHDGRAVANFILDYCDLHGIELTNLSLQKVVFFCHAWFLAKTNNPLIKQKFEAWKFGPVLPYLYREFSAFEDSPIKSRALKLDPANGKKVIAREDLIDEETLISAINFYSRLSPWQLVELSHIEGGPWHKVWNRGSKINPGMKIENSDIQEFYVTKKNLYATQ